MNALASRDPLLQAIAELRAENGLLREQVLQYQELLAPCVRFPAAWRLTLSETRLLASLYGAPSGFRTKVALHVAISPDIEVETEEKLVDVMVHKVRKKLPPEVKITTVWGEGYAIDASGRKFLAAALAETTGGAS